ncbi:MAG TPA: hypothetical protein VNM40_02745 [Candidatus Paceibacterota bacterium]|nr:hypothetical protein [Candidatus Paceibacterota bacterium]
MSLKEILFVVFGTILLLGALLGAAFVFLVYVDFGNGSDNPAPISCAEEDFAGLCGVRQFLRGERAGVEGVE